IKQCTTGSGANSVANDSPADDHRERLHELVPQAEMIVRQLEEERARWKSWGEAFASGMRGEQRTGAESDAPIRIELTQSESENRFWRVLSRLGKVLSPLAVLVSALGFLFTLWQYGKRVE